MSIQTHSRSAAPEPENGGLLSRWQWLAGRLSRNPNPVWIRELKQSVRLSRTPVILAVITGMITLLIASIGGVLSVTAEPAQVGIGVFHTFFSLAFAIVTAVGPAVAAATIASEKSGRTWEALLLTGITPAGIARGKFLAALTYVLSYVVMLAPVGGLSFLFGGVAPAEVCLAFLLLGLVAALSVAFGLAMSSKFASPAVAIVVTLLVALPLAGLSYGLGGVALSFAVHDLWPGVSAGAPVWLPTAYVRADFGLSYFVFLLLCPVLVTALPGWLFYEITIANMAGPSDDNSTRLRIWMLASGPLLALVGVLAAVTVGSFDWIVVALTVSWLFSLFLAFLVAGEPLGPSVRVESRWALQSANRLRRWLGPGVARAGAVAALIVVVTLGSTTSAGVLLANTRDQVRAAFAFGGYATAFSLFLIGFCVWARARSHSAGVPRVLGLGAFFLALLGPYIALAIAGILLESGETLLLFGAPSPAFAFVMVERYLSPGGDADVFAIGGTTAAVGWTLLGIGLFAAGTLRAKKRWRQERTERSRSLPLTRPAAPGNE
jgi:hypothetical protein